jgi:hypothetical protein
MALVQKNVMVPKKTWDRLRRNAQASGVPLCIFLVHLIDQSVPVAINDLAKQEALARVEHERDLERQDNPAPD